MALGLQSEQFKNIWDICQRTSDSLQLYFSKRTINFNPQQMFQKGVFMGKGSFGEVRSVDFKEDGVNKVAIKKILRSKLSMEEFDGLVKFSSINVGPSFYGCHYDETNVYIVQTLLYKDLSYPAVSARIRSLKNSEFLDFVLQIVLSLKQMWDNNYVHNDLKEDNIMVDFENKVVLIDFGMASTLEYCLPSQGSPLYMSPRKWVSRCSRIEPRDDLYSIGIMIGMMLAERGYDTISKYVETNNKFYHVTDSCFSERFNSDCNYVFKSNTARVLKAANFGHYNRSPSMRSLEKINFTTFVAMMIEFNNFKFSYQDCIDILTRQIAEFKKMEAGDLSVLKARAPTASETSQYTDEADTFESGRKHPMVPKHQDNNFQYAFQRAIRQEEEEKQKKSQMELDVKKKEEELLKKKAQEEKAKADLQEYQNKLKREEEERNKALKEKHQKMMDDFNKREALRKEEEQKRIQEEKDKANRLEMARIEQNNKRLQEERERKEAEVKKAKEIERLKFEEIEKANRKKSIKQMGLIGKASKLNQPIDHNGVFYHKHVVQAAINPIAYNFLHGDVKADLSNKMEFGFVKKNDPPKAYAPIYNTIEEGIAYLKTLYKNLQVVDGVCFEVDIITGRKKYVYPFNISPEDRDMYYKKMDAFMESQRAENNKPVEIKPLVVLNGRRRKLNIA